MAQHPVPNVPFVEAKLTGSKHKPKVIVLRASSTPSTQGAALAVAQYWHRTNVLDTCHYVLDSGSAYRCIPDEVAAPSAEGNQNGIILVDLCFEPTEDEDFWFHNPGSYLLTVAADLVTGLCRAHKIKPTFMDTSDFDRWSKKKWRSRGGIAKEFPGEFPMDVFLALVEDRI